jgi:hypothetical protein
MDARLCKHLASECLRLSSQAVREAEARVLRDLSHSWTRIAGQLDRYDALVRDGAIKERQAG